MESEREREKEQEREQRMVSVLFLSSFEGCGVSSNGRGSNTGSRRPSLAQHPPFDCEHTSRPATNVIRLTKTPCQIVLFSPLALVSLHSTQDADPHELFSTTGQPDIAAARHTKGTNYCCSCKSGNCCRAFQTAPRALTSQGLSPIATERRGPKACMVQTALPLT